MAGMILVALRSTDPCWRGQMKDNQSAPHAHVPRGPVVHHEIYKFYQRTSKAHAHVSAESHSVVIKAGISGDWMMKRLAACFQAFACLLSMTFC